MMWFFILYVVTTPIRFGPYDTEVECLKNRAEEVAHYLAQHPDKHGALVLDCHQDEVQP